MDTIWWAMNAKALWIFSDNFIYPNPPDDTIRSYFRKKLQASSRPILPFICHWSTCFEQGNSFPENNVYVSPKLIKIFTTIRKTLWNYLKEKHFLILFRGRGINIDVLPITTFLTHWTWDSGLGIPGSISCDQDVFLRVRFTCARRRTWELRYDMTFIKTWNTQRPNVAANQS